jgi:hypothetical protein
LLGDLIDEGSGGETSGNGLGVVGELQNSTHTIGTRTDGDGILGVLDSDNHTTWHKYSFSNHTNRSGVIICQAVKLI